MVWEFNCHPPPPACPGSIRDSQAQARGGYQKKLIRGRKQKREQICFERDTEYGDTWSETKWAREVNLEWYSCIKWQVGQNHQEVSRGLD